MSSSEKASIDRLTLLIEENLGDPLFSLDDVYKELGVSKTQLHRIIKEETQLSTTLFIRNIRLKKAQQLLATTPLRITEIANLIGIDSPQNFSKYFIQEFNISPTEYRKLKQEETQVNETVTPPLPAVTTPQSRRFSLKNKPLIIGLALILVACAGIYLGITTYPPSNKKDKNSAYIPSYDNSIAVLPFKSQSNNQTFTDGVLEEIHSSLSLLENLKVISRTSSNQYKDTDKTTWQIGDELQVAYVLRGSVLESNNRVEITLELVRTQDDIQVWEQQYEGELRNVFNLMNQIVKDLAVELKQKITPNLSQKLERVPTKSVEAYNEFLQGQVLMITRTKEKLAESLVKFNKALSLDPDFAEAHAYKAIAYQLTGNMGYVDLKSSCDLAEQSALKAIQLDAQNGTAYAILGNIYKDQFKWQQAQTSYEIALKYRPNDAQTLYWYSLLLRSTGKLDEAIQYSSKAVALDPLYPVILAGHILNCGYAGQDALAQKSIQDGKLLFDNSFVYYMSRGYYYLNKNDYPTALREFKKVEELNPDMRYFKTMPAFCEAKLGHKAPAQQLLQSYGNEAQDYLSKSMLYAGLGQKDSSIINLQKAADLGTIHTDIVVHPTFKLIRQDPRFKAILQKFNLTTR